MKIFRRSTFRFCALLLGTVALNFSCRAQNVAAPDAATAPDALMNKADIGVNLEGLSDWSRALMFNDAMKTSRAWGNAQKPWEHTVQTDALGWPLEDAGVIVAADTPGIEGVYGLSFEGRADVRGHHGVQVENLNYNANANSSTARVLVPDESQNLFLSFENTGGGVKNVRLLRPDSDPNATFNADFLNKLAPFSTLRFMDYLSTNNNPTRSWSERTTPQFASQARERGGALEYVVELANVSGKDIWVNVPDRADDDYARQMATTLKNGLTKNQKVYVEWSNEVWNWQFGQATRNLDAAKIEGRAANSPLAFDGDNNEGYWAMRRIAQRGAEISQIFREVFDDSEMNRVRPIYATQVGYEEVYRQGFAFLEHQYEQPSAVFYGVAGAPYFQISDELNKKADLTEDEIFAAIPTNMAQNLQWANTLGAYARFYNLHHLSYEGGQHLQDHVDAGNAAVKIAANRDARMGQAVETYLSRWQALGGETLMYFTLTSGYSKWGSWGLVESLKETSPKYAAAIKVINAPAVAVSAGTLVPATVAAGDFVATNRWDKKGADAVTIEPQKWAQFQIRVPQSATYKMSAQLSSGENATASIWVNARKTGDLQIVPNASSATTTFPLAAGLNELRVRGEQGRFDLRSLTLSTN